MAAGLGFKTFTTGEVLTAADVNGYLMQGVLVFATEAARNSAITSPQEGQFAFTKDTNSLWYYTGSAWAASGATGDIEGVTAGVGISGGGTSGTVTITNSMATAIDAKGDLVPGTGADTFSRLAVGANGTVLTADSAEATGLKWAAPASGGGLVLLNSGGTTLSGSSVTISFTPTDYTNLFIVIRNPIHSGAGAFILVGINGTTTAVKGYYAGESTFAGGSTGWLSSSTTDGNLFYGAYADGSDLNTIIVGTIYDINNTTTYKVADYKFGRNSPYLLTGQMLWTATSAVSSLKFAISTGTFSSGTVYVYGVK